MNKSWLALTMQGRMRGLIIFSIAIVLSVVGFGAWKIRQFDNYYVDIQTSSGQLQQNLQQNFNVSRLLASIHSNLRLYMQSADDAVLASIRNDAKTLQNTLPVALEQDLAHLQEIIDVLAIRMKSLQENNEKVFQADRDISNALAQNLQKIPQKLAYKLIPIVNKAKSRHQELYVSTVMAGQMSDIKASQSAIAENLTDIENKLDSIGGSLSAIEKKTVGDLMEAFYSLDDASSTVTAIRLVAMETELEIISTVELLKNAVAEDSLSKNASSFTLMQKGMVMAKKSILYLVATLAFLALLFTGISLIISKNMVAPLVEFVSLLRNLGRMMAGQHENGSSDAARMVQLSGFIKNRRDEIGEVAHAIRDMLTNMQSISFFRKTIEADESTREIYERLARIFIQKLGLTQFVIYEKLRGQASMEHVFSHPPELKDELPEFGTANNCRAKRTGAIITSYDDQHICNIFPFQDSLDHYCVPMIVGGHVIGVVQFLFSKDMSKEEQSSARDHIAEAQNFIAETLPVLQSKHLAGELEEMATKDQLTGLFNRRYLESSLDQIVAGVRRRGTNLGVLMCDLDFFKQVNDKYGHDAGDAVLTQLAQVLLNAVRSSDLVIRFGGEEFIILLMDCEKGTAANIAENIREAVENYKFQATGQVIQKTTSIGVTEFPASESQGIWEAIKFADVALYSAKDKGRNRVEVFKADMWEDASY